MDKPDHEKERKELLSSPFIENPTDDADNTSMAEQQEDGTSEKISPSSKSSTISRSPLRFRERLAHFFGGRGNVDQDLKTMADAEEQESLYQDTIKSTETRGSSLLNEQQTYYNTIRNQHIEDAQDIETESKIPPLIDVPPSRLFLSVYPEQGDYFNREKEMIIQSTDNYPLLHSWRLGSVVCQKNNPSRPNSSCSPLNLRIERNNQPELMVQGCRIEDKMKLNEVIIKFKKNLKDPCGVFEIFLFKGDFKTRRLVDPSFNGGSIAIKCPVPMAYKLWKGILRITLGEQFYNHQEADLYRLKNMISGLSFVLKREQPPSNQLTKPEVLVKMWITPQHKNKTEEVPITGEQVGSLVELFMDNLDEEYHTIFHKARYIVSKTRRVYPVYSN